MRRQGTFFLCLVVPALALLDTRPQILPSKDIKYTEEDVRQLNHFCSVQEDFGNSKDFKVANTILEATLANEPRCTMFAVGVHNGSSVRDLSEQPWYAPERTSIYGWEITPRSYDSARRLLSNHPEVRITRNAISNTNGDEVQISGINSGVNPRNGIFASHDQFKSLGEFVTTKRWDTFIEESNITKVDYALIDVEGHEMAVVDGMRLERNARKFPVFQYELGGSWRGIRHWGNQSMADAGRYFENLGYEIYLMGEHGSKSSLIPWSSGLFKAAELTGSCLMKKRILDSNALVVLKAAMEEKSWLRAAVDGMVRSGQELLREAEQ